MGDMGIWRDRMAAFVLHTCLLSPQKNRSIVDEEVVIARELYTYDEHDPSTHLHVTVTRRCHPSELRRQLCLPSCSLT